MTTAHFGQVKISGKNVEQKTFKNIVKYALKMHMSTAKFVWM